MGRRKPIMVEHDLPDVVATYLCTGSCGHIFSSMHAHSCKGLHVEEGATHAISSVSARYVASESYEM
jgi:hypothetical protein